MVQRYATLIPSGEEGLLPIVAQSIYQGASIRPELDQFWCTFLLTYLLLNLDKKHTVPHTTTPTLPRIADRPTDAEQSNQNCALTALSEPKKINPNFSSLNPATY